MRRSSLALASAFFCAVLEDTRVHVPVGLPGGEQWLKEMRAFTAKPQTTGNYTYENAVASTHGDYVTATAYAVHFRNWRSEPRYQGPDGQLHEKPGNLATNAPAYTALR